MPQSVNKGGIGKYDPSKAGQASALAARIWPPLFAFLCVALAVADIFHFKNMAVRPIALALVALATAPWSLPWFAGLVQSFKVGDVTLNFRELQQKVDQQQRIIEEQQNIVGSVAEVGVGGTAAAAEGPVGPGKSYAGTAAPDRGSGGMAEVSAPEEDSTSKPEGAGRKLSAEVKPFPGSATLFAIHASVATTDPAKPLLDNTRVTFGLPTFATTEVEKTVKNGAATLDCLARGPFILSADLGEVVLKLDLARDIPYLPAGFVAR